MGRAPSLAPRRRHQEANDAPDNGEHRDLRLIVLPWGLIMKSKQVAGHEGIEEGRIALPLPLSPQLGPQFQFPTVPATILSQFASPVSPLPSSLSLSPSRLRFLHFLTIGATSYLSPSTCELSCLPPLHFNHVVYLSPSLLSCVCEPSTLFFSSHVDDMLEAHIAT